MYPGVKSIKSSVIEENKEFRICFKDEDISRLFMAQFKKIDFTTKDFTEADIKASFQKEDKIKIIIQNIQNTITKIYNNI